MTQPDIDALRQAHPHGLKPLPPSAAEPAEPDKPLCQHGCPTIPCRHTRTEEKHKKHIGRELRGIPLVGAGEGAIQGTRPGVNTIRDLERALDLNHSARRIVNRHLYRPAQEDA